MFEVGTAPKESGIYAWWFTPGALRVPAREYAATDEFDLLYTGISPRKPTAAGKASTGNIRSRLRSHAKRDASWSTCDEVVGDALDQWCAEQRVEGERLAEELLGSRAAEALDVSSSLCPVVADRHGEPLPNDTVEGL